ncbi:MAG TPA: riboflavin synthase [Vicinamibacterales bacterium]|nr:riboflavin synthase [Vicinamibacterales bacterium]
MFTGLIEATGRIESSTATDKGRRLVVTVPETIDLAVGDSLAINGVCLTVAAVRDGKAAFDVSPETLRVTTLGDAGEGRLVNLERPLRADARLGGHFVLGHVDATGWLTRLAPDGDHYWIEIEIPQSIEPYVIHKGSIAIDGVSLTVASLDGPRVGVQIVPFTFGATALRESRAGEAVNLEADVLGKYVERLMRRPS